MAARLLRRLLFWLIGVPAGLALTLLAVANRHSVDVGLWPLPWMVEAPLYALVLGALAVGLGLGATIGWIGGAAARRRARAAQRQVRALEKELAARTAATPPQTPALPAPTGAGTDPQAGADRVAERGATIFPTLAS